jgi:peptidoglycan/LPS O-acetylase OafA/YrhL
MEQQHAAVLKTKPHYDILDGLRGIAAIAVVIFHFMECVITDYTKNFIGHGFLAVDFFFCLSGFVIGYAYDNRIGKMGVAAFFKSRLIRLHPLVILGSILGVVGFLVDPFSTDQMAYNAGSVLLILLTSLLLIPYPVMEQRYFNNFNFNAPAWSLFWEYIANILYAFVLVRVGRKALLLITIAAGALLCFVAYCAGNLMGGWAGSNFWEGGARVAYSFSAGLLVYRSNWIIKNRLGFIGIGILLFAAFVMPWFKLNWLVESLVVLFYFPLLVSLGAGAQLAPALKKICVFSGKISYPLYMTHYAFIWIFAHHYAKYKPGTEQLTWIIIIGTILLLFIAYLAMVLYDTPLRRYLTTSLLRKKPS